MKFNEYGLTHRDEQALDVAKLYYSGLSQAEIAPLLHIGRPTVSKLLNHARARGFVRVEIDDPREKDTRLINALKEKYQLLDVRLVVPRGHGPSDMCRALGQSAAAMLQELVVTGDSVGIAWSETMLEVAQALKPADINDVKLVQITGTQTPASSARLERSYAQFANAFNAQWFRSDAPLIFSSREDRFCAEAQGYLRAIVRQAGECRIMMYSPGGCCGHSSVLEHSALSAIEREQLVARAVGEICARFVDEKARICSPEMNSRTASISLPDLRKVEHKIAVAGGKHTLKILNAALSWGYANRLVTDHITARHLADF